MTNPSPAPATVHARDGLHALLCSLFPGDGRDLRRFASGDPALASVVDSVPWLDGLNAIVHEFIERCVARGLVDEGLFRRLQRVRPHRHLEIAAVAGQWGYELPVTPITGSAPRRWPSLLILGSLALVGLIGLGLALPPFWSRPAAQELPAITHAEDPPPASPMKVLTVAPDPPKQDPPEQEPPPLSPAPPDPAAKSTPRRCHPPSKQELLDRLRRAGQDGGPLRRCWLDFWAQRTVRAESCPVRIHGDSARDAVLTFTNQMQRIGATACLSTGASTIFGALKACPGAVDHTLMLVEIQPPAPGSASAE